MGVPAALREASGRGGKFVRGLGGALHVVHASTGPIVNLATRQAEIRRDVHTRRGRRHPTPCHIAPDELTTDTTSR
jgi:hypothetical protein